MPQAGQSQREQPAQPALPAGTVTFLLADIERSSKLWESDADVMAEAIAGLDRTVDAIAAKHSGVRPRERGEGDSFLIAFHRASDAIGAALDVQRADLAPIRVRVGVHTGEIQLRDDENYVGDTVNRCARLRDIAYGGQTVLSQATVDLIVDRLPTQTWLVDLGMHRLRDLARPEHVHQLCGEGVESTFPPLRSLDSYLHNLPVQLTTFVGRGAEAGHVRELLSQHRLVTLTGSGGCGKTRLALQIAADVTESYEGGVWHVDLVPVAEPDDIAPAIARALGVALDPTRPAIDAVMQRVASARSVVILDNCEHLITACAAMAEVLLRACTGLTILATSREPLGVGGEVTYLVPSLGVPASIAPDAVADIAAAESVELFVERARRVRPAFDITEPRVAIAVAEICRRLDGIPLAVELAAARVRVLAPEQIASALHDRFRLLTGGSRTAMPRQQTLRASVDWSHDLLTEVERVLFRRLAVFAGSFDLEAVEDVAAGDGIETYQALDQLTLLVDKSLVVAYDVPHLGTRYRLLETVRQYALERLSDAGEVDRLRTRHRDHYVSMTMRSTMAKPRETDYWLRRATAELDNLALAMQWSIDTGDQIPALTLAGLTAPHLGPLGHFSLTRRWCDEALRIASDPPPEVLIPVFIASGQTDGLALEPIGCERAQQALELAEKLGNPTLLIWAQLGIAIANIYANPERCLPAAEEAVRLAREARKGGMLTMTLQWLGLSLLMYSEPSRARAALTEALDVAEKIGAPTRSPRVWLATALAMTGELNAALGHAEVARTDAQGIGDVMCHGQALWVKGMIFALQGDAAGARACSDAFDRIIGIRGIPTERETAMAARVLAGLVANEPDQALAWGAKVPPPTKWARGALIPQQLSSLMAEAELAVGMNGAARARINELLEHADLSIVRGWALRVLASIELADGDIGAAESVAHKTLQLNQETGDTGHSADILEVLAATSAASGRYEDAARLLGAADAARGLLTYRRLGVYDEWYAGVLDDVRDALADDFDRAWEEGAALSLDEAVAFARRGRGERKRPSIGWASLTPAEVDVVRLVAAGLSNKDIADKLFISPRTVQAHLTHVYAKLGIDSRVQLATEAARELA